MRWIVPVGIAALVVGSLASRWFLGTDAGERFLADFPGRSALRDGAPTAAPWWMQWQHALNFLLIILMIRSGWLVYVQQRPEAYWTRRRRRTTAGKSPTKMSLYLWLHLTVDVLWVANGALFIVLLFATGGWKRIVPAHWDIFPNALSAGLQYLSLNWPHDMPWVNYNALQVLAYFTTVFVAAPAAIITGLRLSPIWSRSWRVNRVYPTRIALATHLPIMIYFAIFIVVHVALVFATGMRKNLNYMFANQPNGSESWWGLAVFCLTFLIVAVGWVAARPLFMHPVASLSGKVTSR